MLARTIRAIGTLLLLATSHLAFAQTTITTYLDVDRSVGTGCTVTTSSGPINGIDVRVDTVATVGNTPTVSGTSYAFCTGGSFGSAIPFPPSGYPVGANNGTAGSDVVEYAFPLASIFGAGRVDAQVYLVTSDASGTDVLLTANGAAGGAPIILLGPQITIPTLGFAGACLLGLALLLISGRVLRQRRVLRVIGSLLLLVSGTAWAATIILDGQIGDWTGIAPLATDPAGDTSSGAQTLDMRAAFFTLDDSRVYGRVDIADLQTTPPVFTSANATTFTVGTAGTFTVTATGLPAPTISQTGTLPAGVTFNPGTGVLSGTPAAGTGGTYAITFTATNGIVPDAVQNFTLTVNQAPAITSANSTTFTVGTAGTFTVTATGFPAPTFSETGALPAGVTLSAAGVLSGTPAAGTGGTYPITITAANGVGANATQSFTLTVNQAPAITSANSTTFTVGTAGTFTVTTTGVPSAAAMAISETGALPTGVTFVNNNDGTATLAGTPAAGTGGSYAIVITANNGVAPNATQNFTLTVNEAPTITSANSTTFVVGTAGSFTVTASGFPASSFSATGTLPTGVTLSTAGVLSGTPAAGTGGSYPIVITANNGIAPNATQNFTLTVNQAPAITSANGTTFTVGTAGTFTVTTTGVPSGATMVIGETGALPAGVTFVNNNNGTATLSGTPGAGTGGTYPITITANNGVTPNATQSFTLTVNQAPAITSANATTFTLNTPSTFTVTTTGFPSGATMVISETGALPAGITFTNNNDGTATIGGTPTAGGVFPITITANNGVGTQATQSFTLSVTQPPSITSANSTTFTVGSAGTFTVTTTGVPSGASMVISQTGALPAGVTFVNNNNGTATLSGTPGAGTGGSYPITITANNGVAPNATQNFTLNVNQAPAITSANNTTFVVGTLGSFNVTASGNPASTFSFTGTLPSGVTLSAAGVLSGTPGAGTGGSYPITITATNGVAPNATQNFTLNVNQAPAITSANAATFTVGTLGTFSVTTTGVPSGASMAISATGALPAGVTFVNNNNGTATLSGTPGAGTGGTYPITITANNGVAPNATQSFTLTINQAPAITSANSATFTLNSPNTFTVTTTGFPSGATMVISETGALPTGVTFTNNNNGTATLAGTPTVGGTFPITITANNGVGTQATQSFTLSVTQPPSFTSVANATFTVGQLGTFSVTTTGVPTVTSITRGGAALPTGVTFTDNGNGTGTLTGTPGAGTGGTYAITFTATNGVAPNATQNFTLTVNQAPAITSANSTTFTLNTLSTFTVTTTGFPSGATMVISETGALPAGVTFTNNNNGTATLGGTPTAGGTFPITITANNGVGTQATQNFTLTVSQPPSITSANSTTFAVGTPGTFTVTTTGIPTVTSITRGGAALPTGVTFTDNGNGTATLAGTPGAGTGGTYAITFTATNGVPPNATQNFTLTVNQAPAITSANNVTFPIGQAGTFSVTTTGFPTGASMAINATGTLPAGVTFVNNNNGTATLSGTPGAGTAGNYPLNITAANGVLPNANQAFSLTVSCPVITFTPAATTFNNNFGTAFSQSFTGAGGTGPYTFAISAGALPAGITLAGTTVSGTATDAGTSNFSLTATDALGCSSAPQAYVLNVNLVAGNDNYSALGNVLVDSSTGTAFTVTTNDSFPAGTTISAFDATSTGGGQVTMTTSGANIGQFTYDPPRGKSSGTDTFTYTLSRNGRSATGTVTFTVAGRVWFINNNAGACSATCDGRLSHPYANTSNFQTDNTGVGVNPAANDPIFVYGGGAAYSGALVLLNGQRLIGRGATGTLAALGVLAPQAGQTLPTTGGTSPVLGSSGVVVTLGTGNFIHGLTLGDGTTALLGNGFGTLTMNDNVVINGGGVAMNLVNGALAVTTNSVTSTGGANNITMSQVTGNATLGSGTLSGATSTSFVIGTATASSGGTATISYGGTISQASSGQLAVQVRNRTGGTLTLSGQVTANSGGAAGVSLTSNTGSTIAFTGGLALSTGTNPAFTATGGGTVTATQNNTSIVNTLATTTGTALNVANTTIGAAGLTFRSIASNGATSGIIVNATGTSGGLTVTGNGGACTSAGTCTGGAIQNSTGDGVVLTATDSPSFTRFNVTDSAGTGADDGMVLTNITGTVTIANSTFINNPHNGVTVDNNNTNMAAFNFTNSTISCAVGQPCQPSGSIGNDGLLLSMRGTSVLPVGVVSGSTFTNLRAVGVQIQGNDSAKIGDTSVAANAQTAANSFVVSNNTFTGNGQGIDMDTSQTASMSFRAQTNTLTLTQAAVINAFTAAGAGTAGTMYGFIDGNIIGSAGTRDSGSVFGSGIRAVIQGDATTGAITISNNTVREVANADVITLFGQNGNATAGTGRARFKVTGNNLPAISGSNQAFCGPAATPCAGAGIFVLADEGNPVCSIVTGNSVYDVSTANGSFDIYLAERVGPPAGAQLTVEGTGAVLTYVNANNTLTGANKSIDESGGVTTVGAGTCGAFTQ